MEAEPCSTCHLLQLTLVKEFLFIVTGVFMLGRMLTCALLQGLKTFMSIVGVVLQDMV